MTRANEHSEEQEENGNTRVTEPQVHKNGNLQCLFSVHVDDMEGIATREVAESLLKHLNKIVRLHEFPTHWNAARAFFGSSVHASVRVY